MAAGDRSERPAGESRCAARDSVDVVLEEWASERPDLDVRPVGIVTRLARVQAHLYTELAAVFDRYELTPADFQMIAALRRTGPPYRMTQARLMAQLALTSGTVSVRVDRLVRGRLVVREPDPADGRVSLVRLTAEGERLFDEIAPVHLANEDRLLSALDDTQRDQLADLLRRLLVAFEHGTVDTALPLGMRLEPAHIARARRLAVGLSDTPGLLVAEVLAGTPAADAGLNRGDLLIAINGTPARSESALGAAVTGAGRTLRLVLLRGDHQITADLRLGRAEARTTAPRPRAS